MLVTHEVPPAAAVVVIVGLDRKDVSGKVQIKQCGAM